MNLLAKEPDQRLASAHEVVENIQALEEGLAAPNSAHPHVPVSWWTRWCRRRTPWAGAAIILAIFLAGVFLRVETESGTLLIDVNDPNVVVSVKLNGVLVQNKTTQREFLLKAGPGVVEVYEKDGVGPLKTEKFTLNQGGRVTVHVVLESRKLQETIKIERTFRSKSSWGCTAEFSPDNNFMAVASGGLDERGHPTAGGFTVWDTKTWQERFSFAEHRGFIGCVTFSPNSKFLALTEAQDWWDLKAGRVKLWEIAKGKEGLFRTLDGPMFFNVAFSPDGARVAAACADGTVRLWGFPDGKEQITLKGHADKAGTLAFAPRDKRLFASGLGIKP